MKKTWRDEMSDEDKNNIIYGRYDFDKEDWQPILLLQSTPSLSLRVLDIKEYDPILQDKSMMTARAYEYFEGDLNEVENNLVRNERLSPELNIDSVTEMDDKFMLVQDKQYRVYFDHIFKLREGLDQMPFNIYPTAKALNYGFIFQSLVMLEPYYNPVIPFYDNTYGYIISTNLFTPVTVNIKRGTKLAYSKRIF